MAESLTTEQQVGEGFAFFRWHCLRWPEIKNCKGLAEICPQCEDEWPHITALKRVGPMRKSFETYIRRSWHASWKAKLVRNQHGAYEDLDIAMAWSAFSAGWRRARR